MGKEEQVEFDSLECFCFADVIWKEPAMEVVVWEDCCLPVPVELKYKRRNRIRRCGVRQLQKGRPWHSRERRSSGET